VIAAEAGRGVSSFWVDCGRIASFLSYLLIMELLHSTCCSLPFYRFFLFPFPFLSLLAFHGVLVLSTRQRSGAHVIGSRNGVVFFV